MRRAITRVVGPLLLAAAVGCRTHTAPTPPVQPPPPPDDSAADWHALIPAPFGSALKDIPGTLHEVLLFQDEAPAGAAPADAECFSTDAAPPQLLGRTPADYLLCFEHDRLSRIQASIQLGSEEGPEVYAKACAAWLRLAAAAPPPAATRGADCAGRAGPVRFVGHLADEPAADGAPGGAVLSLTLDAAGQ